MFIFALLIPFCLWAADPQAIKLEGFLDTYYAYDTNRPKNNERQFTTQPERHNEPSVNLAYVGATLQKDTLRGRLAFQAGNSVEKNTVNSVDEKNWARYIQESYLGKKIGERTWLDAGIFLGNIGAESWISKDNYTYTRALNLDYVPYYSQGLRLEHNLNDREVLQIQIINGWQNMNESNQAKALGLQYKKLLNETSTFTYNNFFGDERVVSHRDRFRGYHNFIFKYEASKVWQYLAAFDIGHQAQQKNNGVDLWYAATLTIRRVLTETRALAMRFEHYNDSHNANVITQHSRGFNVLGASTNFDQKFGEKILWRTEVRSFYSQKKIYPQTTSTHNRWDGLFVTSLSLSI
jgi:hypothetical protein